MQSLHACLCLGLLAGAHAMRRGGGGCRKTRRYADSADAALSREGCCEVDRFDPAPRFAHLWDANDWLVAQPWWRTEIEAILRDYPDLTLNHVAWEEFYSGNERAGMLPATAQVCLRLAEPPNGAGKDDIKGGIGYYHFNRLSTGRMCDAPNFPLVKGKLEYFINPRVLLERHFIICRGNIAMNSDADCPGKLFSTDFRPGDSTGKTEKKARTALQTLRRMLDEGLSSTNEIAVFGGVPMDYVCDVVTLGISDRFRTVTCADPRADNECVRRVHRDIFDEEAVYTDYRDDEGGAMLRGHDDHHGHAHGHAHGHGGLDRTHGNQDWDSHRGAYHDEQFQRQEDFFARGRD